MYLAEGRGVRRSYHSVSAAAVYGAQRAEVNRYKVVEFYRKHVLIVLSDRSQVPLVSKLDLGTEWNVTLQPTTVPRNGSNQHADCQD